MASATMASATMVLTSESHNTFESQIKKSIDVGSHLKVITEITLKLNSENRDKSRDYLLYLYRSHCYQQLKTLSSSNESLDMALDDAKMAIKLASSNAACYLQMGLIYAALKQYKNAENMFFDAISKDITIKVWLKYEMIYLRYSALRDCNYPEDDSLIAACHYQSIDESIDALQKNRFKRISLMDIIRGKAEIHTELESGSDNPRAGNAKDDHGLGHGHQSVTDVESAYGIPKNNDSKPVQKNVFTNDMIFKSVNHQSSGESNHELKSNKSNVSQRSSYAQSLGQSQRSGHGQSSSHAQSTQSTRDNRHPSDFNYNRDNKSKDKNINNFSKGDRHGYGQSHGEGIHKRNDGFKTNSSSSSNNDKKTKSNNNTIEIEDWSIPSDNFDAENAKSTKTESSKSGNDHSVTNDDISSASSRTKSRSDSGSTITDCQSMNSYPASNMSNLSESIDGHYNRGDPTNLLQLNAIWIGRLHSDTKIHALKDIFKKYGTIIDMNHPYKAHYAFLHYDNPESPVMAIADWKGVKCPKVTETPNSKLKMSFSPSSAQKNKYNSISAEKYAEIVKTAGECPEWRSGRRCAKDRQCQFKHIPINNNIDTLPCNWKLEK